MNAWFTLAVTIFDVVWLSAVLALLWRIWRNSVNHTNKMEQTLVDVSMRDAESARKAVEVAQAAIEMLKSRT